MHLYLFFFIFLSFQCLETSHAQELRYRDWKFEAAIIPSSYSHNQSGAIGDSSGKQDIQLFYQINIARRFDDFKLDLNYRTSQINLEVEKKSQEVKSENFHLGVLYKNFILRAERVATPYVTIDAFNTGFQSIKADWLGVGYLHRFKGSRWRLGALYSLPVLIRGASERELKGSNISAWIEHWGRFSNHGFSKKLRWKVNLFHERRNWSFERRGFPGKSELNPQQTGLLLGMAYVF